MTKPRFGTLQGPERPQQGLVRSAQLPTAPPHRRRRLLNPHPDRALASRLPRRQAHAPPKCRYARRCRPSDSGAPASHRHGANIPAAAPAQTSPHSANGGVDQVGGEVRAIGRADSRTSRNFRQLPASTPHHTSRGVRGSRPDLAIHVATRRTCRSSEPRRTPASPPTSERLRWRRVHACSGRPTRARIALARMPASLWPSRRQEANDADPAE
jgi:hypothetical protein